MDKVIQFRKFASDYFSINRDVVLQCKRNSTIRWEIVRNLKGGQAVPRYYFNTRIAKELILDPEGEELPDPDRAWEAARQTVRAVLKTESTPDLMKAVLEVTDDEGEIVLEFPFAEALIDDGNETPTRH
jgi:hypothetical protein